MNIYVGNFSGEVTDEDLKQVFAAFGEVVSATVVKDKFSGESRGFGFVEMPSKKAAEEAMEATKEIKGKMVVVNEARPRADHRGGRARHDSRGGRGRGSRQGRY